MKTTVAEIIQTGKALVKNYSRSSIQELKTFTNVYELVKSNYSELYGDEDLKHITHFVMGYCDLD